MGRVSGIAAALLVFAGACTPTARTAAPAAEACRVPSGTLTDVQALAPDVRAELRYATSDNFTGAPLPGYDADRVLLRPAAAAALARVQARLAGGGVGLKVWDAYRPVRATRAMVEWAERSGNEWVLEQGYVARRSGHNTGGTVDLTLVRLGSGEELEMGTAYDDFSAAAHTANAAGTVARNRRLLVTAMAAEGFDNYAKEWWHFSFGSGDYRPLDLPLGCFGLP
jgi:D-alanyl-D-alanine dipeptidase